MSKADTLLKKATVFERLALYSDRKAFLGALAQNAGRVPQVTSAGVKVWIDLASGAAFDSETGGNPVDGKTGQPLKKATAQGAGRIPQVTNTGVKIWIDPASGMAFDSQTGGNQVNGQTGQPVKAASKRSFFFKTLAQGATRVPQVIAPGVRVWIDTTTGTAYDAQTGGNPVDGRTGQPFHAGPTQSLIPQVRTGPQGVYSDNFNPNTGVFTSEEQGGMAPTPVAGSPDRDTSLMFQKQLNAPAIPEKGTAPAHSNYPSVDKKQQAALFTDLTTRGLGFFDPNDADGKLGPQTRQAIDLYKKNFFANKPHATDAEVLRAVSTPQSYRA